MHQFQPHFDLASRRGVRGVNYGGAEVIFKTLRLKRAAQLWREGFPYLHITAQGAKLLFGESTVEERIDLLASCRTPQEVEAILKIKKPTAPLMRAATERLDQLGEQAPGKGGPKG